MTLGISPSLKETVLKDFVKRKCRHRANSVKECQAWRPERHLRATSVPTARGTHVGFVLGVARLLRAPGAGFSLGRGAGPFRSADRKRRVRIAWLERAEHAAKEQFRA